MTTESKSTNDNKAMQYDTLLCAAFPGTGKTTMFNKFAGSEKIILDSDSSKFNKDQFPQNYLQHIKDNIGKADTSHESEVLNIPRVIKSVCGTNGCEDFYPNGTGFCKHCGR